jgi:methanesulfonate monooxygenase small subunit
MIGSAAATRDAEARDAVSQFLYATNLMLDAKDFKAWLDCCAPEFTYSIRTFSFEIRKEVTFLDLDLAGMTTLVKQLPRHNSDQSTFTRHVTVATVDFDDDGESARVVSAVTIYRTALDGGTTAVFAVGRYHDTVGLTLDGWRLRARELRLVTRNLGIGTHYPL